MKGKVRVIIVETIDQHNKIHHQYYARYGSLPSFNISEGKRFYQKCGIRY